IWLGRGGTRAAKRAGTVAASHRYRWLLRRCSAQAMRPFMTDTVLIIDFGSQVTQLIARRVREAGVYSEIVPFGSATAAIARHKPKAIILSGGPASVLDKDAPLPPREVYDAGVPVLGICYGEQA